MIKNVVYDEGKVILDDLIDSKRLSTDEQKEVLESLDDYVELM